MANPTKAQWADALNGFINVGEVLGEAVQDHANIVRAFGLPSLTEIGIIRKNWTDGAVAVAVGTGAGNPGQGTPAQAVARSKQLGKYSAPIYDDSAINGGQNQKVSSLGAAVNAAQRLFFADLILSGSGNDNKAWGILNFITLSPNQLIEVQTPSGLDLLKSIGKAERLLPKSGYHVCLTTTEGYNAVYDAIQDFGGTTPDQTSAADFGFSTLTFRGIIFFDTEAVVETPSPGTDYNFFNIGPEGCEVFTVPGMFQISDKKLSPGEHHDYWDLLMFYQVMYGSKRAAVQLRTDNA